MSTVDDTKYPSHNPTSQLQQQKI